MKGLGDRCSILFFLTTDYPKLPRYQAALCPETVDFIALFVFSRSRFSFTVAPFVVPFCNSTCKNNPRRGRIRRGFWRLAGLGVFNADRPGHALSGRPFSARCRRACGKELPGREGV